VPHSETVPETIDVCNKEMHMVDWTDDNWSVKAILDEVQKLEEMGGPATREEYIAILEYVQSEIEMRISTAKTLIREDV
jgi:hypothetical protein